MSASITVQNIERADPFGNDLQNLKLNSRYNIIIHCIYNIHDHFDTELAFLNTLGPDTLVILFHAVEQGVFNRDWIEKLNDIIGRQGFKLVYLTGLSHNVNVDSYFPHKFDIEFFPVFDICASRIWVNKDVGPQPITLDKPNKYSFLNLKDTQHRRFTLGTLIRHNLLDQSLITYRCREGKYSPLDFSINRMFTQQQLDFCQTTFDLCEPHIPISIDSSHQLGGLSRSLFLSCYLAIIGETQFVNNAHSFNMSFVTEKTFNAISNNQMFIIVGQTGSLDLLHLSLIHI